ncbi:MAG: aminotransferase class V-fold PLP-dependent enzyme [Deltaproteobacteria bacterium]|nr:aminotransferase class V-fold PLP-dependent enzyme [Deltaproteobacteria bacterium]
MTSLRGPGQSSFPNLGSSTSTFPVVVSRRVRGRYHPAVTFAQHWTLDPKVTFLNHGSFGACPRVVIDAQLAIQARLHQEPVTFFARDLPGLYQEVRSRLAEFLGASPRDLAFVPNASTGVNTVLASFPLSPGDEILLTDHGYNACNNAAAFYAARAGATVRIAQVPFPIEAPEQVTAAIMEAVTPKTKLALIDHATSPTALVLPLPAIVRALRERGVETLVDGAHGPGMLPIALDDLGAAYYTGNCHKWLCAGKGAAFLHVRGDLRQRLRPLVISHGASLPEEHPDRFFAEFDWTGTLDPSAILSVPVAIDFFQNLLPGGWTEVQATLHNQAKRVRARLVEALGLPAPCPESMIGAMVPMILPGQSPRPGRVPMDGLHFELFDEHQIEVPVFTIPKPGLRILRVSTHLYNQEADVTRLIEALRSKGLTADGAG